MAIVSSSRLLLLAGESHVGKGWSFRRIEREAKVRREKVSRYARPADPNGGYEETIREKLGHGLTAQRI